MTNRERSVHDNILYGYTVECGDRSSRTYGITLYTSYQEVEPEEFTDVVFEGVVAHHFTTEIPNSVLLDIEEVELGASFAQNRALFERQRNYGWPFPHGSTDELLELFRRDGVRAFQIGSSFGIDGWVWAQRMLKTSRCARRRSGREG